MWLKNWSKHVQKQELLFLLALILHESKRVWDLLHDVFMQVVYTNDIELIRPTFENGKLMERAWINMKMNMVYRILIIVRIMRMLYYASMNDNKEIDTRLMMTQVTQGGIRYRRSV